MLWAAKPLAAADPDGTGPDAAYHLVHDFSNDWLVYNEDTRNYVPYTRSLHENDPAINLVIDLLKYRNYELLVRTGTENHLFINGALQKIILPDSWVILNIDSLFMANRKDDLLLTFFGHEKVSGRTVQIGHKKDASTPLSFDNLSSVINIKPKDNSSFQDLFILVILLIVALNGLVLSIAPLFYRAFMNPLQFFRKENRDEKTIHTNPFSTESFFMIMQVALLMTPLCFFITYHSGSIDHFGFFTGNNEKMPGLLIEFAEIFLFCVTIIYLKLFSIKITSNLLGIESSSNQHFMKTLQSSFHFYLLVSIILMFCHLYNLAQLQSLLHFLIYLTIAFYFIRFILLYFIMNISGSFINLYLFSYLCIVEIIPLTIGIKYILQ